ncbi:MAG: dihydrodipicolinate synthase family protein [Hyphomicrobiaceae bacterium]|nr:dihydrodipicolinate synthase family protein [Hyphomicrobiaceae bacterium]
MPALLTADAKGVYVIAATPFTDSGAIDYASIDSLVDFYARCGVDGMTILGVMGEFQKLSESETLTVAKRFIDATKGRFPVVVGVSNPGTDQLVRLARGAMEAGAAGVMVMPIPGLKTDEAVLGYMSGVLSALGPAIPVCVQDYPQLSGVWFSADCFSRMVDKFPQIVMFKHEEAPGLRKLSAIRKACDGTARRRISILCGNGGIHLPQEYQRGADGAMTGFAFPEMLVQMDRLFRAGKAEAAEDLNDLYLPIIRHELQPGIGLAIRKEILRRRGAIASAAVRAPGPKLDSDDMLELDRLLARLERRTGRRVAEIATA